MKSFLLRSLGLTVLGLLAFHSLCRAYWVADGSGLFKVVVEVSEIIMDSKTGKPIAIKALKGATVSLSEAGAKEVAADPALKSLASLFDPVLTNAAGDAIVYYYGGWSSSPEGRSQSVRGILKVSMNGYEDYQDDLRKRLGGSLRSEPQKTPTVEVILKKLK